MKTLVHFYTIINKILHIVFEDKNQFKQQTIRGICLFLTLSPFLFIVIINQYYFSMSININSYP